MIDEEGKLLRKVYVTHSATASFFNSFNSIFLPLAALNEWQGNEDNLSVFLDIIT